MSSVLDLLKPMAQPSMNGFDLSQKHVYGSAPGRLDAPLFIETMPHDKFQIDIAALMRTMTLNTSAFLRGKVTFDFYFVPYTQLWHPFNQFVDQRLDPHSALQRGTKYAPMFNLYNLFKLIKAVYDKMRTDGWLAMPYYLKDIHGIPWYSNVFNMLDFFGYGNYLHIKNYIESPDFSSDVFESMISNYQHRFCNVFRPAAYQHIWYDYYRNKFFDNYDVEQAAFMSDYVKYFNFDDIMCDTSANSIIGIDYTDVTAVSNMRIYGLFTQRYVQYKQDLIQSVLPSQQFGAVSDISLDFNGSTIIRGTAALSGSTGSDYNRWHTNAGEDIERSVPVNTSMGSNTLYQTTGQHPSVIEHDHELQGTAVVQSAAGFTGHTSFDVIAFKRAEALQKWRQDVMRAGNMVDDNFRSHFGVTPRYESDNNALKLGSFEGMLNVNTVETTAISAESGNNKVGDLGATATCVINGQQINFQCSDFGVIVCLQYFRPESEYSAVMIDRAVTLHEPFDFPMPEFCNLGLNPVTMSDYNFMDANVDEILGYNSQYWWYKQAIDKSHGEFAKYVHRQLVGSPAIDSRVLFKGDSVMWNAPRIIDMIVSNDGGYQRSKASFYVTPQILNDIFGVNYFTLPSSLSEAPVDLVNQLIFNVFFNVKAIRPLTSVGLPNF